jgi:Fe-S-cluster containining protein
MIPLKEEVLLGIYDAFEQWGAEDLACKKGCATCCTQNVVITAVEGELIHRFVREQGKREWFADRLQKKAKTRRPEITTNGFAASCLEGKDVEPDSYGSSNPCPFLEEECCAIYEVRPFSCRCFASTEVCRPGVPAIIGETYLSASTAVMQIIEHLGQGEFLGNMLDVLLALCDIPENRKYFDLLPASLPVQGLANVVPALPLPGFLLLEEEMEKITPLLESLFNTQVGDRTIEDILNNKK